MTSPVCGINNCFSLRSVMVLLFAGVMVSLPLVVVCAWYSNYQENADLKTERLVSDFDLEGLIRSGQHPKMRVNDFSVKGDDLIANVENEEGTVGDSFNIFRDLDGQPDIYNVDFTEDQYQSDLEQEIQEYTNGIQDILEEVQHMLDGDSLENMLSNHAYGTADETNDLGDLDQVWEDEFGDKVTIEDYIRAGTFLDGIPREGVEEDSFWNNQVFDEERDNFEVDSKGDIEDVGYTKEDKHDDTTLKDNNDDDSSAKTEVQETKDKKDSKAKNSDAKSTSTKTKEQEEKEKQMYEILRKLERKTLKPKREKGKVFYSSGDMYHGDLFDEVPDGYGTMEYQDGSTYQGTWKNGYKDGQGTFIDRSGDVISEYTGMFRKGMKTYYGKITYSNGVAYQGGWNADMYYGYGECDWNSWTYHGTFLYGLMDGAGTFFYPDGTRLVGNWDSGHPTGFGKYIQSDKECSEVEWTDEGPQILGPCPVDPSEVNAN